MSMLIKASHAVQAASKSVVDVFISTSNTTMRIIVDGANVATTIGTKGVAVVANTTKLITKKN